MATIKIKRSTTANAVGPSEAGEISVNLTDKKLFIGDGSNALEFGGSGSFVALSGDQSIAGAKSFSSAVTLPSDDPTATTHAATKGYVDGKFATIEGVASAFAYKGTIDASGGTTAANAVEIDTTKYTAADESTGDYWKVSAAGYLIPSSGGSAFFVNQNDGIVYNGADWDVIDNTNSTVSGTANVVSVSGTTDTGFTVDISSNFLNSDSTHVVDGGSFGS
jgi:hypothetical protein